MNEIGQKTGVVTGAYLKVGVIEISRSQFKDLVSGGVSDEELPFLKQKLFEDRHFSGFAFSSYGPQFRFRWSGGLQWTELELVDALRDEIKAGMVITSINEPKGKCFMVMERLFNEVEVAGVEDLIFNACEIPTGSVRFRFSALAPAENLEFRNVKPRSFDLYLVDEDGKRVELGRSKINL